MALKSLTWVTSVVLSREACLQGHSPYQCQLVAAMSWGSIASQVLMGMISAGDSHSLPEQQQEHLEACKG
jgi:cytochrome b